MNGYVNSIAALSSGEVYVGGSFTSVSNIEAIKIAKYNSSDTSWSSLNYDFINGVDGTVHAIFALSADEIYVGGSFAKAGGVACVNIAKWNGSVWSDIGSDLVGIIYTIYALSSNEIYVGGKFTSVTAANSPNVAVYDGSAWKSVDFGTNNTVTTIFALHSGAIYIGGYFTKVGIAAAANTDANYIALYDGSVLSTFGDTSTEATINGPVFSIYGLSSTDIYIGGSFTKVYDFVATKYILCNNIIKWNSVATKWSPLIYGANIGVDGIVNSIHALSTTEVYVGGSFIKAGGVTSNRIAQWNGVKWSTMGTIPGTANKVSTVFAISTNEVYVGGSFSTAGGINVKNIALWNGTIWQAIAAANLTNDPPSTVSKITAIKSCNHTKDIVKLKSNIDNYSKLHDKLNAIDGTINDLCMINDNEVYIAGLFKKVGDILCNNIARWDGTTLHNLFSSYAGTNGEIKAVHSLTPNNIYVGGFFDIAGCRPCNNVAMWNGSKWQPLYCGTDGVVYTIYALSPNEVYIGGSFSSAGSTRCNNVAKWDGIKWCSLGKGTNGIVNAIYAISSDEIYIGGKFEFAGTCIANNVARWNGNKWVSIGFDDNTGVNGEVTTINASYSDRLCINGKFTVAGCTNVKNSATWVKKLFKWIPSESDVIV